VDEAAQTNSPETADDADAESEQASGPATRAMPSSGTTGGERMFAGLVALAVLAVLAVAAWIPPSSEGHGTHQQLGLPACGWLVSTGRPCATCGMTTSFASLTKGDIGGSLSAQPFGTFLALGSASVFWIALHTALTGSRAATATLRLVRPRLLWVVGGVWAASWAYKLMTW